MFAGQNSIINFLLPARFIILKGDIFSLIPQHIGIAAAYNVNLASMLRELSWISWKDSERRAMHKISESYSETFTNAWIYTQF